MTDATTPTGAGSPALEDGEGVADVRREQILRAALGVIAERGFFDARIADVAEGAGVSPALVIYYFKTKDRLLTDAMRFAEDAWFEAGKRRIKESATAQGRLRELVAMACLPDPDSDLPESWTVWLDLWARAVRHHEVARVREEFDQRWRDLIQEVVSDGQAAGELARTDPAGFAIALSALLDGLAIQIALDDQVVTARRGFEIGMAVASKLLGFEWTPAQLELDLHDGEGPG